MLDRNDDDAADNHWKHWRQQRTDKILDVVLKDEPAPANTLQARWIANEARRLKRQRRHELIYSIVFYAVCGVAVVAFIMCILGMLR